MHSTQDRNVEYEEECFHTSARDDVLACLVQYKDSWTVYELGDLYTDSRIDAHLRKCPIFCKLSLPWLGAWSS
jgi:hypothetical protein